MLIQNYGHKCFFLGLHKLWLILIAVSLWGTLCVGDLGGCFLWRERKNHYRPKHVVSLLEYNVFLN